MDLPDQVMDDPCRGARSGEAGAIGRGAGDGEVEIPPSTGMRVEGWRLPAGNRADTRKITVTFRELTLMLP